MLRKVAAVTGGNKGIGFAIVKGLCKNFEGDVYLTARNKTLGIQTVESLKKEGLSPIFHQLDVTDNESIDTFKTFLVGNYGGLDVLVNNAGVTSLNRPELPFPQDAGYNLQTNYYGTLAVCKALFPILNSGARVVHISSTMSTEVLRLCSDTLHEHLHALSSEADVTACMAKFKELAESGTHVKQGWPNEELMKTYGVSKTGLTLITPIQQATFDANHLKADIVINACCPGYTSTDQTVFAGRLTPEEGADTPIYLALLPPNVSAPRGQFLYKRKVYDLRNKEFPDMNEIIGLKN